MPLPRIPFELEKLKDPEVAEFFQAQVCGRFAALKLLDREVDTLVFGIKEVLLATNEEVPEKPRKIIQQWKTKEFLNLCDKKS